MSKYILVVDLPDDGRCKECPLLDEERDWCVATDVPIDLIEWGNPKNWISNLDCPLIPVDRVMWKMNYLNDQENVTGSQATAWCQHVLRDELGVTE
jgi:hypothetical protein